MQERYSNVHCIFTHSNSSSQTEISFKSSVAMTSDSDTKQLLTTCLHTYQLFNWVLCFGCESSLLMQEGSQVKQLDCESYTLVSPSWVECTDWVVAVGRCWKRWATGAALEGSISPVPSPSCLCFLATTKGTVLLCHILPP